MPRNTTFFQLFPPATSLSHTFKAQKSTKQPSDLYATPIKGFSLYIMYFGTRRDAGKKYIDDLLSLAPFLMSIFTDTKNKGIFPLWSCIYPLPELHPGS